MMTLKTIATTLAVLGTGVNLCACIKSGGSAGRDGTEVPTGSPPAGDGAPDAEGTCAGEAVCAGETPPPSQATSEDVAGLGGLVLPSITCGIDLDWAKVPLQSKGPATLHSVGKYLMSTMRSAKYSPAIIRVEGGFAIIARPESFEEESGRASVPRFGHRRARPSTFVEYVRESFGGQKSHIRLILFVLSDKPKEIAKSLGSPLHDIKAIEIPYNIAVANHDSADSLPTTYLGRKHVLTFYVTEVSRSADVDPYEVILPDGAVLDCDDHLTGSGLKPYVVGGEQTSRP